MTSFFPAAARRHRMGAAAIAVAFSTIGLTLALPLAGLAQETFDLRSTLAPAEDQYRFEGSSGQTVSISMTSEDFDPLLVLLGPDGEEVAMNDDFGGTLNSNIVFTLPTTGTYTVIARSFSGQGGDYAVSVRIATDYEISFAEGQALALAGDFAGAIAAFSNAIEQDPSEPAAYLARIESRFNEAFEELGGELSGPEDLPDDIKEAIASDYESAADLYEAQGETDFADVLRQQALVLLTGELPIQPEAAE
ncbi:MAG: pre-peptidase C-terminal domain-containing protein [Cyanobacteria bacterium P01_H01_bin.119]